VRPASAPVLAAQKHGQIGRSPAAWGLLPDVQGSTWAPPGSINLPQRNRGNQSLPSGALAPFAAAPAGGWMAFMNEKGPPWPGASSPGLIRRRDRRPFWLAGLWDRGSSRWQLRVESCACHHRAEKPRCCPVHGPHAGDPARRLGRGLAGAWPMAPDCGPWSRCWAAWASQGWKRCRWAGQFPSA